MAKDLQAPVTERTATLEMVGAATRTFLSLAIGMGFIASAMAIFMIPIDFGDGGSSDTQGVPLKVAKVLNVKSIMNQDDQFVPMKYYAGSKQVYQQNTILEGVAMNPQTSNQALKIQATVTSNSNTNGGATTFSIGGNTNTGSGATSFSIESIAPSNTNSGGGATSFSIESIAPTKTRTSTITATSFSIESVGTNTNSGGGATSFSIESVGGATSFSIEPVPVVPGTPAQMAVMEYKLATDSATAATRKLTICIGRSSATTLYVGTDGSTYANSSFGLLNGRTTNESCATIKSRALKLSQVTGGSITVQSGDYASGEYVFIRAFMYAARFNNSGFEAGNSQPVTLQTEAPIYAGFGFTNSSDGKSSAPAIIMLKGTYGTTAVNQAVCFPETTMNPTTGGPVYYYDSNGTPFYDIFLQNRALGGNCSDLATKALRYDGIAGGVYTPEKIWPANISMMVSRSNVRLASFTNGGIQIGEVNGNASAVDPLLVTALTNMPYNGTFTVPRTIIELVGVTAAGPRIWTTLCYPETTVTRSGDTTVISPVYFDAVGNPYKDILLTNRYMTTNCTDTLAKGLKYTDLTSATAGYTAWPVNGSLVLSGYRGYPLGTLTNSSFTDGQVMDLAQAVAPLRIEPQAAQDAAVGTYTTTEAHITVVGKTSTSNTTQSGALSSALCLPELTMNKALDVAGTFGTPAFFDTDGNAYKDIFLMTRYLTDSCNTIQSRSYAPTSISNVTMTPIIDGSHGAWIGVGKYLYGAVGSADGWQDRQTVPSQAYGPFTMFMVLTGASEPVTIPKTTVSFTDNMGATKNLCWGGWSNVKAGDAQTAVFYNREGKGFTDMFMTRPYTCPTDSTVFKNIHIISKTSTTATIGWETSLLSCSRINYGTVINQLNSGPVGETTPCNVPIHQSTITGLTPNTTYLYEIVSGSRPNAVGSGQQTFTTATVSGGGIIKTPVSDTVVE